MFPGSVELLNYFCTSVVTFSGFQVNVKDERTSDIHLGTCAVFCEKDVKDRRQRDPVRNTTLHTGKSLPESARGTRAAFQKC